MRGCRVFCCDPALGEYLKTRMKEADINFNYSLEGNENIFEVAEEENDYCNT